MKIAYNPITAEALTTAPANNDITFDLRGLNIFVRGVKFKGTDTTYSVFKKHTSSGGGYNGLVPVPSYTSTNTRFLREDGTWQVPSNQYTYSSLTNQDLDTLKTEGEWYYLAGGNTVTNGPTNINNGGELYVGRNASGYRYQKVILTDGLIWFRIWNSSSWSSWKRWYTDANTDSKVLQSTTTTSNYRPLVLGYNNSTSVSDLANSVTQQVYTTTNLYVQPSSGSLWANKLYSGGKAVITDHQSLSNYVTLNTAQTITGQKTFTNPINSSLVSNTHIDGNKGKAIINSTASAGSYTMLFKGNSTNGYFTHGAYQTKYLLQYTAKSTVDTGTNVVTKSVTLLDESGNSYFPGNVTAPKFIGTLQGNADSATKLTTSAGSSSLPIYFADGKPVACTASSLFSNLSNSGNNISITVAGQNRVLQIYYANRANQLNYYLLPYTNYNKVGWYCKIASISITRQYSSTSALLCITDEYTTTSNLSRYGFIYVKVQQQSAFGSSPNITLKISGSLTTSLVTGILTLSSSSSKLDIYLKEDLYYQRGYISFIHGAEDIRTNSQELIQTLPSGTVINSQYGDISNQAVSLLNSRTINGTSFNGTTDITTTSWGATRTISLTGAVTGSVSTNGSGNITINTTYGTGNITNLDNRYLKKTGDTMSGVLAFFPTESSDGAPKIYSTVSNSLTSLNFEVADDVNDRFVFRIDYYNDTNATNKERFTIDWNSVISKAPITAPSFNGNLDWSKLTSKPSGGNAGQPVYISSGSPIAIDWRIGNSSTGEHNANNVTYNFCGYYSSNGPATSLGASTSDGALYTQAYNSNYVAQIAQDYRNGNLFVRGKNNGTWQAWKKVALIDSTVTNADKLDGVHLNGIFTGFNYSQSKLTATIGTVSKTVNITGSYPSINSVTMNTVAYYGNCMGMADLASSNSNVNPNNQTGWHHFINMSYNTESDNMWQTQFAIKAGTTEVWVRSRAGGSTSDSSAWAAPWVRLARITDNVASSTAVKVSQHTTNNTSYPIVWSNQSNTNTNNSELFKSWQHLYYNPSTQKLTATGGFIKGGSSDSYVLLGGGGHATLSGLGGSHTHTVFKNNVMVKGTNGISDSASIHLALGDSDTGFKWISDGVCQMYANNVAIGQWNSSGMNWLKQPFVNSQKIWHAGNDGSGSGLDADLLDGYHATGTSGNVLRKSGYVTSDASGLSSYWGKVASFTWQGQYNDQDITLYMHSAYNSVRGIVHIRARWNSSTSVSVNCWVVTGNIIASNLRLYYDSSSVSSPLELWYNIGSQWGTINTSVISETNRTSIETFRVTLYNTTFSTVQSPTISSYIQGSYIHLYNSVDSSIKLQTPRQINGTNFNGTANITTSYWGTARTLTIGNSAKSVNGSGNVSWSLSEIGAASSSHTHTLSQISDLHSSWDALLKVAPSGYVTRWPSISEVTSKQNLVIKLNGGTTEGTNMFTYNATAAKTINITASTIGAAPSSHTHSYVSSLGVSGNYITWTRDNNTLNIIVPYASNSDTVDGLHANSFMRAVNANGYYGMASPDGSTSTWIRTTSSGILPYQSGDSTSGHCSIGNSTWYFNSAYIQNIYSLRMEASNGFYQQSDIRLKENIQKITSMSNIELVEFIWKKDKKKSYGVIAQQVEKYFPELVNIDKETGYKSVNYDAILIVKIAQLENKIKQLESKLL